MCINFFTMFLVLDCSPILSTFQVILLEHIIMCRLVTGHKATALQEVCCLCILWSFLNVDVFNKQQLMVESSVLYQNEVSCLLKWRWLLVLHTQISQVCQLCQQSPRLFTNHAAQLHTLLVSIFSLFPWTLKPPSCYCISSFHGTKTALTGTENQIKQLQLHILAILNGNFTPKLERIRKKQ